MSFEPSVRVAQPTCDASGAAGVSHHRLAPAHRDWIGDGCQVIDYAGLPTTPHVQLRLVHLLSVSADAHFDRLANRARVFRVSC